MVIELPSNQFSDQIKNIESTNREAKESLLKLKDQIKAKKLEKISLAEVTTVLQEPEVNQDRDKDGKNIAPKYIFALQAGLRFLGIDTGSQKGVDAVFGEKTQLAFWRFQKKWNDKHPERRIKTDGVPGPASLSCFVKALAEKGGIKLSKKTNEKPLLASEEQLTPEQKETKKRENVINNVLVSKGALADQKSYHVKKVEADKVTVARDGLPLTAEEQKERPQRINDRIENRYGEKAIQDMVEKIELAPTGDYIIYLRPKAEEIQTVEQPIDVQKAISEAMGK